MLELPRGLSATALTALADLERRTLAEDGGRLKLEWSTLRGRSGTGVEDALWWEGDRLVGFAGRYAFGPPTVEVAGMVDPAVRRRGIGTALLAAVLDGTEGRQVLLVTPRAGAGTGFAAARGGVLHHSEHALVLTGPPADGPQDPQVALRPATSADGPEVTRLLRAVGWPALDEPVDADRGHTLVVEAVGGPVGEVVGTVRTSLDRGPAGTTGGVYGFVVDPARQGRGVGRDVLRRVCRLLREQGADRVTLEVEVDNERALGLYTSLGFTRVTTEDYWALPG